MMLRQDGEERTIDFELLHWQKRYQCAGGFIVRYFVAWLKLASAGGASRSTGQPLFGAPNNASSPLAAHTAVCPRDRHATALRILYSERCQRIFLGRLSSWKCRKANDFGARRETEVPMA